MTIQFPNRQWAFNYSWYEAQQGKNVKLSRVDGKWIVEIK